AVQTKKISNIIGGRRGAILYFTKSAQDWDEHCCEGDKAGVRLAIFCSYRCKNESIRREMPQARGENLLGGHVGGGELAAVFGEGPGGEVGPNLAHDLQVEIRIVDADHAQAEDFVDVEQMPQIGA